MQQTSRYADLLARSFALAIFIAPFILLPSLSEFANLPQAAWLQVTTFFFLSLFLLSRYPKPTLRFSPLLLPIIALLLWCFVGLSYAVNPYEVIKRFLHLLAAAAAFFLVLQLYSSTDRVKTLLWAISLSGLGVALIGMSQHLFGFSLIPQMSPPAATFANKNMAAHFVVLTMPASIMLFLLEKEKFAYLLPVILALQTTFLAYARTRASWLALFVEIGLVTLLALAFRKKNSFLRISSRQKMGLILGLVLVACLIGLGKQASLSGYKSIVSSIEHSQAYVKEPAKQIRFAYWLNTLAMAKDHLVLGVGLGNFKSHYPLYHNAVLTDRSFSVKKQAVDSHNDVLQGIAELGIVGLGLFIWLILKALSSAKDGMQQGKQDQQIITGGATIGLFAFVVIALFSFPMACSMPPFLSALYLGLLATNSQGNKIIELAKGKMRDYGLLTVVIFLVIGLLNFKELRADHFLLRFINMEYQQNWPAALEAGKKAVKAQPLRYQLFSYLGRGFMNTENLPQAEKSFILALKTSPADINTMTNLGVVYLQSGHYQLATDILEKSLAIFPENWAAYSNIGSILMRQGKYGEAKEYLKKASKIGGKSKLVWFNLGEASLHSGDLETAIKAFENALDRDPDWGEAAEQLFRAKKQKSLQ